MVSRKRLLALGAALGVLTGGLLGPALAEEGIPLEGRPPAVGTPLTLPEGETPRSPLSLNTPITYFVLADGLGKAHQWHPGTVQTLLQEAGVEVGPWDEVSAESSSPVGRGQILMVKRGAREEVLKTHPVAFTQVTRGTVTCKAGVKTKVVQEGKEGILTETWERLLLEGEEVSLQKVKEEVTTPPQEEVTSKCEAPKKAPKKATPKATPSGSESKPLATKISGTKEEWMRAAGIPEAQWPAADTLVQRESSWNPHAVNKSSGACSLVQSLPCSKIKGDWRDPVTALKWGNDYVKSRYGSWDQALAHSYSKGWY